MENKKPEYPRIPFERDKRYKLTKTEIKELNNLYIQKLESIEKLAFIYNVSTQTIKYWVYPQAYRDEMNKKNYEYKKTYYEKNPDKLKLKRKNSNYRFRKRKLKEKEVKEYCNYFERERRKKKRDIK